MTLKGFRQTRKAWNYIVYISFWFMLIMLIYCVKALSLGENTEAWLISSKVIGFKANDGKTKYMFTSHEQHAGQNRGIKVGIKLSEMVEQFKYLGTVLTNKPIPVAVLSKMWVRGCLLAGGMDVCLFSVLCVVTYRSLWQANHFFRGVLPSVVCLCDLKTSTMRRPRPTMAVKPREKTKQTKVPSMMKLRAHWTQGMLAIIWCRILCLPVCYPKIRLK